MSARSSRLAWPVLATLAAVLIAGGCAKPTAADPQVEWREAADWSVLIASLDGSALDSRAGPPPALPAPWKIEGYVVAGIPGELRGVVASEPDQGYTRYAVLLRDGTVPDTLTTLQAAPWPGSGRIPARFLQWYESLGLQWLDGTPARPLAPSLRARIGAASVTIAGHGTGAVTATYLSFELAREAGNPIAARLFASPPAGDAVFARAYARAVSDHRAYANVRDPVPHIAQDHTTHLDPARVGVFVRDLPECNHLALSYAAMLDFRRMSIEDWQSRLAAGGHPRDCIGPSPASRIAE